jgi:polygalacturonase
VPAALSFISIDSYDESIENNMEVEKVRNYFRSFIYGGMLANQSAFVVPGTFYSQNSSVASQAAGIVTKLRNYEAWANDDPLLVGLVPWHYNNRCYKSMPAGFAKICGGISGMPAVISEMKRIGSQLPHREQRPPPPATPPHRAAFYGVVDASEIDLNSDVASNSRVLHDLPFKLQQTHGGRGYRVFDLVKDFGGVGDNRTDNTASFREAMAAISRAAGGTLVVPAGSFRTAPLRLVSNMTLDIRRGATIAAHCNITWALDALALPGQTPWQGLTGGFINTINASDVVISGEGAIDGCGSVFWAARVDCRLGANTSNTSDCRAWMGVSAAEPLQGNRPFLVRLENSQRLRLEGVQLRNSPMWTLVPLGSSDIHITNISLFNPSGGHGVCFDPGGWDPELPYDFDPGLNNCCAPNTDGIDITSCKNVLIEGSRISTGDDGVCMKNRGYGYPPVAVPTSNVYVTDMDIVSASCPTRGSDGVGAFKLGTQLEGGVSEVTFADSHIGRAGYALKLDSPFGQAGYARNVTWRNIEIDEAEQAIYLNAGAATAQPNAGAAAGKYAHCNVSMQTHLSRANCVFNQSFGCFGNGSMWAETCHALFLCDGAPGVLCGGQYNKRTICPCVTTTDTMISVSGFSFIDIVGHRIGDLHEDGHGKVVAPGVNVLKAGVPSSAAHMATGTIFKNISLSNKWHNVTWNVNGFTGPSPIAVSPPIVLNKSADNNDPYRNDKQIECADLRSSQHVLSSYWGSHHFLRYDNTTAQPKPALGQNLGHPALGMPALGWQMYSDRSLQLHHGAGLWLQLLGLWVDTARVEGTGYSWRPDFVRQSGKAQLSPVSVESKVYYSDMNTVEADFNVSWSSGQAVLELVGIPNPANTYVTTHPLSSSGSTKLAVTLSTNLTHGAGGTIAGCIAAKACTPLTLHAVVSVSASECGDIGCGNLTVKSVCASPPVVKGPQCALTKQTSHSMCVLGKTYGCFPNNKSMWVSACRGVFACSGINDVNCPGTGPKISGRNYCGCAPPPPERSCNYSFSYKPLEPSSISSKASLHAKFQFVNATVMAKLLAPGNTQLDEVSPPRGHSDTTAAIDAWLAEAEPPSAASGLTEEERITYYRSWFNYWMQIETITAGTNGETGMPMICSSKSEYGRSNALWDTAFHMIGLLHGGPNALQLARSQVLEYTRGQVQDPGGLHLPGGMSVNGGGGMQVPGILCWATLQLYHKTGSLDLLEQTYAAFADNNHYWYNTTDTDGNGLCEWSGLVSGWDNSPRWDDGIVEAVDLNSWLCLDQQSLAQMATLLHKPPAEVAGWWRAANRTAQLMQDRLWDEDAGLFFDYSTKTNSSVAVITPATFFTLLPGVATPTQAQRMAAQIANTSTLRTTFPLPVISRSDKTYNASWYWRGPVWININWITIVGLQEYGLDTEAAWLRKATLSLVARTDIQREYYNSLTGEGLGAENFMWTGALFVSLANMWAPQKRHGFSTDLVVAKSERIAQKTDEYIAKNRTYYPHVAMKIPNVTNKTVMAWVYDCANDKDYERVISWMSSKNKRNLTFNAVSDGSLYTVMPNTTIIRNSHNIDRHRIWKRNGYRVYPCVNAAQHADDGGLSTMRLLFQNEHLADVFINLLVADAVEFGYDGYNIDFEVYGNLTDARDPTKVNFADGVLYSAFLQRFASACHTAGISLSVDVDTPAGECEPRANGWGRNDGKPCPWYTALYNFDTLSIAGLDRVICMSTYTWGDTSFMNHIVSSSAVTSTTIDEYCVPRFP